MGDGAILKWLGTENIIVPYDADPTQIKVIRRDCIKEKPKYYGTYVVTRSPQLSKAEAIDKTVFETYGTDDLYKCFVKSLRDIPNGGIIVLPLKFMTGIRDSEERLRNNFFGSSKPLRFNVFDDHTVVISFRRRLSPEDYHALEPWHFCLYPEKEERTVLVDYKSAPIFRLESTQPPPRKKIYVSFSPNLKGYVATDLVLVKKEKKDQEIGLYMKNSVRLITEDKDTLSIRGFMSKRLQQKLLEDFNRMINYYRTDKIERLLPRISIDPRLAEEAIKSILWSYADL